TSRAAATRGRAPAPRRPPTASAPRRGRGRRSAARARGRARAPRARPSRGRARRRRGRRPPSRCRTWAGPCVPASRKRARRHVGGFGAVIVYFPFAGGAEYSAAGVRTALTVARAVETVYVWLARRAGELKHFDVGLWLLFATGTLATTAGFTGLARVFEHYSPALVFTTLGLTALLPPLLGGEPFTYYYARRQTPKWQQRLPEFVAINRVMTGYWA